MNVSSSVVMVAAAFLLVKAAFEFLVWVGAEDKDAIYRRHLDSLFDALDEHSLYELARQLAEKVVSRLGLADGSALSGLGVIAFAAALMINYVSLLFSFAEMARHNVNFVLADVTLPRAAWLLFRELGFTGSQQMAWMSACNTLWALAAFFMSRRSLLTVIRAEGTGSLLGSLARQAGIFVLAFFAMFASLFASVWFYDWGGNTETQQYLYTQSVRMLYGFDKNLVSLLLLNAVVSCIPSAIYFVLLFSLTLARAAPNWVRTAIRHVVFRLTTDSQPVLKQLATIFGICAALLTAARTLIAGP